MARKAPPQFGLLAEKLGRKEWLEDPRFVNPDARRKNTEVFFDARVRSASEQERVQ